MFFIRLAQRSITLIAGSFSQLVALYPALQRDFDEEVRNLKSKRIPNTDYSKFKRKLLTVKISLSESDFSQEKKSEMVTAIFDSTPSNWPLVDMLKSWSKNNIANYEQQARNKSTELDEPQFLQSLSNAEQYGGDLVAGYISKTLEIALEFLIKDFPRQCTRLHHKFQSIRQTTLNKQISAVVAGKREILHTEWRTDLLQGLHEIQSEEDTGTPVRYVSCWHAFRP